jgi:hypothetical protein
MQEDEKITSVDVEKWPVAVVIFSEDDPHSIIHGVLYKESPDDTSLIELKREVIEDMGYDGDPDKLQYVEVPTEEFLELIGAIENEPDEHS